MASEEVERLTRAKTWQARAACFAGVMLGVLYLAGAGFITVTAWLVYHVLRPMVP